MHADTFLADISLELATIAHQGTSFTPDRRGHQERSGYAETLAADYAHFREVIKTKPELAPLLEEEFARYREGYRQRTIKHLHSKSRCLSWMITGPSNFPTRRNEKRNNVEHKRLEELIEFRDRARKAILKKLCPELRPIMAGDSDAVQSLGVKLAEAEQWQERYKAINGAIRANRKAGPAAQVAALVALGYIGEERAKQLLEPDFCGRIGIPDYKLTNNNANIRRMRERIETLTRNKATPDTSRESEENGIRVEDSPADNRIRLFFPGKPDAEVRTRLKRSGFRWSPTIGCWQAYRNSGSMETAKREAGFIENGQPHTTPEQGKPHFEAMRATVEQS